MRALFLADAHLCKPTDQNYQRLLTFLEEQSSDLDYLILLGDIFEFWIGKSTVPPDHRPMIDCLEKIVRKGTQLVYVEGNHDFHLGPVFTEQLNCQVLPDGGTFELDGKKIFLAHGDLANPGDTGYLMLRKLLRSSLIRGLIRILPSSLLMAIASRASHESQKSSRDKRNYSPAQSILLPYAEELLNQGHHAVLTGHYHQPMHEKIGEGELIGLGDWITQFSYAVYENGNFAIKNYSAS
jgi:UDP-2,3-diacylglucosamine hydrolase